MSKNWLNEFLNSWLKGGIKMNLFKVMALILLAVSCAPKLNTFSPANWEQAQEELRLKVLDSYEYRGILSIGLRLENDTGENKNIDLKQISIVLDTGESAPAFTASERLSVVARNMTLYDYISMLRRNFKTANILEEGPLPPNSWREGRLFFINRSTEAKSFRLVLNGIIQGPSWQPISFVAGGAVKINDNWDDKERSFLGTPKLK